VSLAKRSCFWPTHTTHYTFHNVQCSVFTLNSTHYTVFSVHITHIIVFSMQCSHYTHYTVFSIHITYYTLHSVHITGTPRHCLVSFACPATEIKHSSTCSVWLLITLQLFQVKQNLFQLWISWSAIVCGVYKSEKHWFGSRMPFKTKLKTKKLSIQLLQKQT
jgi:hypothetical protein